MDATILTPRLRLTLLTTAERRSNELEWIHALRSDEKASWWSISGRAKTIEDTEKVLKNILPNTAKTGEEKSYRIAYMIHELLPSNGDSTCKENSPTRFIGLVALHSVGPHDLALPDHLFPASTFSPDCLNMILAYQFLPAAWGKGYATEAVNAVLEACGNRRKFWDLYEKVFVRAIVNGENPASQRVMAKTDMKKLGVYEWVGDELWLGGKWRTRDDLYIYGMFVIE
ncbi:hypothetical protein PtrM4_132950 [Pyrenophora tritici-repentis]|uniref:N-acetyltransferase domain-containing protein n=2 Tax=Pyrenophora tritici-repentis TaxID=45151 RepID=A0A834RVG5_9PLEO|nr:uncharacterized protein PTRG_10997 [Pyrenophora tritici-repentis Pt-1C-BFP]EDU44047.1 conserved hypothetical protein [Pyrenophora tritici-repentis Pt-1C-BFP]KAF7442863.1 GNAT family acetyltransferase [Pyrenophora tritici-repentis]KAF7568682.1 hypothetical protein PtrM4_132950 [Pyrenophora tritici-repentis]KAI1669542.1 Acetyltransferase domain containing protein [Pyrenophora tritici-repentis]